MASKYSQIIKILGKDRVKLNEPLANHTTFLIGGPADFFYEAKTTNELVEAIKLSGKFEVPFYLLAGGSKILVSDEGFRGLIIKVSTSQFSCPAGRRAIYNLEIIADAGVPLKTLVEETAQKGLAGLEFAAGIPGTIGGAIRSNAGAWQQAIGEKVKMVKVLDEEGGIKELSQEECQFKYRQSRFKKTREVILEVKLVLKKGNSEKIKEQISTYLAQRQGQPQEPSVGSIFINPKPQSAGELIEAVGLKGKKIGKARISPKHANFIVNLGGATAREVISLIELVKTGVEKKTGIVLEEEICLVGFDRIKK